MSGVLLEVAMSHLSSTIPVTMSREEEHQQVFFLQCREKSPETDCKCRNQFSTHRCCIMVQELFILHILETFSLSATAKTDLLAAQRPNWAQFTARSQGINAVFRLKVDHHVCLFQLSTCWSFLKARTSLRFLNVKRQSQATSLSKTNKFLI